jgi:hypothetical protein
MRIVILEHIGESNSWEWYDIARVSRGATPKNMINSYIKEMNLDKQKVKFNWDDSYFYAVNDDVRAMEISI